MSEKPRASTPNERIAREVLSRTLPENRKIGSEQNARARDSAENSFTGYAFLSWAALAWVFVGLFLMTFWEAGSGLATWAAIIAIAACHCAELARIAVRLQLLVDPPEKTSVLDAGAETERLRRELHLARVSLILVMGDPRASLDARSTARAELDISDELLDRAGRLNAEESK